MIEKHDRDLQKQINSMILATQLIKDNGEEDIEIELLIREKYSMSQEICIHRKKLMGILEENEWQEYVSYVEECIKKVQEKEPTEM